MKKVFMVVAVFVMLAGVAFAETSTIISGVVSTNMCLVDQYLVVFDCDGVVNSDINYACINNVSEDLKAKIKSRFECKKIVIKDLKIIK